MERKIGEIFEYEGEWYQCVEGRGCKSCGFYEQGHQCKAVYYAVGSCGTSRSDKRPVIFKKLEKVGEPVLYGLRMSQRYKVSIPVELSKDPSAPWMSYNLIDNLLYIEVKQQNPNTEDMEANEKTMPIPDGWEFDRIDECGNIVLKKKKKELPKTWLGCLKCVNDLDMIDTGDNIEKWNFATLDGKGYVFGRNEHNLLPRGLGKPILALCQLLVCRNAWWKQLGWKPDWNDCKSLKHCIHSDGFSTTDITQHSTFPRILAFPDAETADDFRNTFKDLIEEAKELL